MEEKCLTKKVKIFKIILLIVVLSIMIILTIELLPLIKNLSTKNGKIEFKDKINSMGIRGYLLLFALQVAQIFLLILPGEPFEVLAGMCYGSIGGLIFIFITVFFSTSIIYLIVKKYKEKYLYNFFKKEKIQKILNSKWYKDSKKTEIILIILFLTPGVPKDLFAYCGALLNIKPLKFICIATFARFPSIISSTMAGANITSGDWKMVALIYISTAIITFLILIIVNMFDKDKISKDTLSSLK